MWSVKKAAALLSIVSLFLFSCTPEDGATGPVGPVGPEGAIGPAGEDGEDGTGSGGGTSTGVELFVKTFAVPSLSWTGGTEKRFSIAVPEINNDVVSKGTLQVFQTVTPGTPTWDALPYSYIIALNTGSGQVTAQITMQYSYKKDSLSLSLINSLGANITSSANFPGDRTFKLVIIPSSDKIQGFEPKTYEELKMVYGLKD